MMDSLVFPAELSPEPVAPDVSAWKHPSSVWGLVPWERLFQETGLIFTSSPFVFSLSCGT